MMKAGDNDQTETGTEGERGREGGGRKRQWVERKDGGKIE